MATHGILEPYNARGNEPFPVYLERIENYFSANDITTEGKKRAIFLTYVGAETYGLIRNLCTPEKPTDKTFADICTLVTNHLSPKPNIIIERFKFNSRSRKDGESVSNYIAELKCLRRDCDYKTTINDMLRDRLVCGINDTAIQRRLLAEK